ncbi:hypothetical protein EJ06DRAFT_533015 [Trichodelitschia bisporula]|uniref:Secreted protein n=1 Tax=Trichodelitschia bisporula TaxID=703511 RepID=A0A6G1HMV8_9PEZI|nr:hypothetical protein EJ06DRAFT_533015 [Trichodelitschia bisporula]
MSVACWACIDLLCCWMATSLWVEGREVGVRAWRGTDMWTFDQRKWPPADMDEAGRGCSYVASLGRLFGIVVKAQW